MSFHRINVFDGGHDHLLPGRWLANTNWLGPKYTAYGDTAEKAVANLRTVMASNDPLAPWFQNVPVDINPLNMIAHEPAGDANDTN